MEFDEWTQRNISEVESIRKLQIEFRGDSFRNSFTSGYMGVESESTPCKEVSKTTPNRLLYSSRSARKFNPNNFSEEQTQVANELEDKRCLSDAIKDMMHAAD
jgi:hypothetical protein